MGFTQYAIQEVQVLNVEVLLMVRKSGLAISLMVIGFSHDFYNGFLKIVQVVFWIFPVNSINIPRNRPTTYRALHGFIDSGRHEINFTCSLLFPWIVVHTYLPTAISLVPRQYSVWIGIIISNCRL